MKRKPSKSKAEFSPEVRDQVERRSGGRCEAAIDGCRGRAVLMHHKKRRKVPDDSAGNAMHLCLPCHEWIHSHVKESETLGWLIRGNGDPISDS